MRAVTPGRYVLPAPFVEDMYRPEYRAIGQTPDSLVSLLLEVKVLQESEREQMFGDALPAGLRLSGA